MYRIVIGCRKKRKSPEKISYDYELILILLSRVYVIIYVYV